MSAVPFLDVSGLAGDAAAKRDVAARIGSACESIGFLCITGHGVPADLIGRVRAAALAFFDLPEAEKRRIAVCPPSYRGYVPLATEGLARSLGRKDAAADLKEAFSIGAVDMPEDAYHTSLAARPHFVPNAWPSEPADFRPAFEAYYRVLSELADRLLGGFALALGVEENWFADKVDRHISNLRALHYPAQPDTVAPGQLRAGEHSDYGSLTILLTEPAAGGLEVRNRHAEWEAVPHEPASFVVNIGDLMAQWTNDRFVSTLHRVANPPRGANTRRLSIAFFHQPNFDALIERIPGCAGPGRLARHAPITSGEHRLMKVAKANQAATA
jgi:isopenicillin N synthase-like dioxygenase